MRSSRGIWIVFAVLGAALWLSSMGIGTHPLYRLCLILSVLIWSAKPLAVIK